MLKLALLTALLGLSCVRLTAANSARWLTERAPADGSPPWGDRTAQNSDPTKDLPDTGVTRQYDLHVSRKVLAPDGVDQSMIVVNGQFPGPKIEANWGDWLEITVHNDIVGPEEGTAMHWHGLNQFGTPFYDGMAAVGHCPITPNNSLTYRFRADEYGTSWYHAHYSAQYTAGVVGPIVIHGPSHVEYDVDIEPVLISDWYHESYESLVDQVVQQHVSDPAAVRPKAVSNLVQGLGVYPCANLTNGAKCTGGSYASFDFVPGTTYRLRLVNTGSVGFEQISIDGHNVTIIANDFVPVQPYQTQVVTLGVGQRTDVLVTATGQPGESYWFRAWNHPLCGDNIQPDGRAVIFYPDANKNIQPNSTATPLPGNPFCQNDPLSSTQPVYVMPVKEPDVTLTITMTNAKNGSDSIQWLMNGVAFKGDFNDPILLDAIHGQNSWPAERTVYDMGSNHTLRIIFINTFLAAHPMHQHGHDFQVLAEGLGTWDGQIVNPSNPQRRDVHMNQAGGNASTSTYLVLQYELDNPGVWPFHCHIAWHLSAGMSVLILERPDGLIGMEIPQAITDTCTQWSNWQQTHVTDVVDSARKRMLKEKRMSKVDWAMDDESWLNTRVARDTGRMRTVVRKSLDNSRHWM